jgi:probable ribonuclease FAU-1
VSEKKIGVKLRGIYTTALSKLLLDHSFLIVEPSEEIQERLGINYIEAEPDVSIENKQVKHTVFLEGNKAAVDKVRQVFADDLEECIFFKKTEDVIEVDFPISMKRKLDMIRKSVTPTINDHHYYKSFGVEVRSAIDMAETLLSKGEPLDDVERRFHETLIQYLPYEEMSVNIDHVKLNGHVTHLGKASVEVIEDDYLEYKREIKGNGTYDGLEVEKRPGDVAVSKTNLTDYYIETKYYNKDGKLRGTYLNINTPVEIYSSYFRYIDLEIDVLIWPDGRREIVDMNELDQAEALGIVTKTLAQKARNLAKNLLDNY